MAKDEKKRQAKLLAKRRRGKARKRVSTDVPSASPQSTTRAIREARTYAVHDCLINRSWKDHGLVTILISRRQPNGNVVFGVYLVDVYCLGVKNTFCNANLSDWRYKTEVRDKLTRRHDLVKCPMDLAHTIVYGGVEYAAQFGFEPNKDFKLSQYVLDAKDSIPLREDVEFGKDGQPLYVSGPHDNVERIMRQLRTTAGEGNFNYLRRL